MFHESYFGKFADFPLNIIPSFFLVTYNTTVIVDFYVSKRTFEKTHFTSAKCSSGVIGNSSVASFLGRIL